MEEEFSTDKTTERNVAVDEVMPVLSDGVWEKASTLISMGTSLEEVQTSCGISRTTLWRMRKDPEFVSCVAEKSRKNFAVLLPDALNEIRSELTHSDARIRQRAAKIVLDKTLPDLQQSETLNLTGIKVQIEYK
jgi:hypothetical protein